MKIDKTVFVAEGAKIIGNVTIEENVNIWFNVVIRSDMSSISIGKNTNVQDLVCIHDNIDQPTIIGENVTIGHSAIIHAATIEDNALIGMGATVLDGAVIESGALVGAGAVIPPGKVIPARHLVVGNPMKIIRPLTSDEIKGIELNKDYYIKLAQQYK